MGPTRAPDPRNTGLKSVWLVYQYSEPHYLTIYPKKDIWSKRHCLWIFTATLCGNIYYIYI